MHFCSLPGVILFTISFTHPPACYFFFFLTIPHGKLEDLDEAPTENKRPDESVSETPDSTKDGRGRRLAAWLKTKPRAELQSIRLGSRPADLTETVQLSNWRPKRSLKRSTSLDALTPLLLLEDQVLDPGHK